MSYVKLLQVSIMLSNYFCHLLFLLQLFKTVFTGRHNSILLCVFSYRGSNIIWLSYSVTCRSFGT